MKFDLNAFKLLITNKNFLKEIEYFEEIDSTNTYLKKIVSIDKKLVIADFQTAGRGRFNRKWVSLKGENLTFSIGIENFSLNLLTKINFLIPVVVSQVIDNLYNIKTEIKWPNDLLLDGKKFCGILIENSIESNELAKVIIGIGINCNQTNFPEEISKRTTSLKLFLQSEIDREILLAKIIDHLAENWDKFLSDPTDFYRLYKSKCLSMGRKISVSFNEQIFTGLFYDVNENGDLILKTDSEILIFNSGEITIIKE